MSNIDRRSFLTTIAGMGVVMVNAGSIFTNGEHSNSFEGNSSKKLIATTDYTVNIGRYHSGTRYGTPISRTEEYYKDHKSFLNLKQLDKMHQELSSMGVTRHQWIVDTYWGLYEDYPHGFNLLEEAAKAAHAHGIEFIAEIKVFEGGGFGSVLPHTMPTPKGKAGRDIRGVFPIIRPFVANNPHLCLKCKPGTYEYDSLLKNIRLIKYNDQPTRVKYEHLTIFTSETNNHFTPYKGPIKFRESVEQRFVFPLWKDCRILHLEGLKIPQTHKYLLIKCSLADNEADFGNEMGSILEFEGTSSKIIPHYLGQGPVELKAHLGFYNSPIQKELLRYFKDPKVKKEIKDHRRLEDHYRDYYVFDRYQVTDHKVLDKDGYIVASLGRPEYLMGNLHPIYKEVREYWLELTRFCLDAGVDGINYRIANHSKLPGKWNYGYNDEVLAAAEGKTDNREISRINGNAYTQFLFEARDLIKGRGKKLIHHLHAGMLMPDDRGRISSLPPNFEWQWEKWINEIADEFELRGGFMLRPWHLDQLLDTFITVTKKANKPFYYQGDFHGMSYEGPFNVTKNEVNLVNNHDGINGLVLYETANYTQINDEGRFVVSPEFKRIMKEQFFKDNNKK